jgi:hypothetical protein
MEIYLIIKKNQMTANAGKKMELKDIMLSYVSQNEKEKCFFLICRKEKSSIMGLLGMWKEIKCGVERLIETVNMIKTCCYMCENFTMKSLILYD